MSRNRLTLPVDQEKGAAQSRNRLTLPVDQEKGAAQFYQMTPTMLGSILGVQVMPASQSQVLNGYFTISGMYHCRASDVRKICGPPLSSPTYNRLSATSILQYFVLIPAGCTEHAALACLGR